MAYVKYASYSGDRVHFAFVKLEYRYSFFYNFCILNRNE